MGKKISLVVAGCFICAANPAGLGCISLRPPCPIHALCTPVRSRSCTHLYASVHGTWCAQHPWDPSRAGGSLGGLWHPFPTLRVTHKDGGGAGGQPRGWPLAGTCLAPALLFFVSAWGIMSCNYQCWLLEELFCSLHFPRMRFLISCLQGAKGRKLGDVTQMGRKGRREMRGEMTLSAR